MANTEVVIKEYKTFFSFINKIMLETTRIIGVRIKTKMPIDI